MTVAAVLDFAYRYRFASEVHDQGEILGLRLATFGGAASLSETSPYFFEGQIDRPHVVADTLLALSQVVRTHFFLAQPALLDPVVTCNDQVLRFEGFSGCCGVYARVDFDAAAFDSPLVGRGTTNVDFNSALRVGLARLRQIGRNHETLFLAAAHCRAVTHPTDRGTFPADIPKVALLCKR